MRDNDRTAIGKEPVLATMLLCFLIVTLDGFDTISITFVAPILARDWGMAPAAMVPVFLATSVGAVIGYMACGPLALRFGTRSLALGSVLLFGLGSLATVLASDIVSLTALRFITALGLGGALPVAISRAADLMPGRRSATAAMIIATGISAGGVLAGIAGGPLMAHAGWTSIFIVGGVLPLLLLPWIAIAIRDDGARLRHASGGNAVSALFGKGLGGATAMLWLFAFLVFLIAYALTSWLPTLALQIGLAPEKAPAVAAAFAMGGLIGDVLLILLSARVHTATTLLVSATLGLVGVLLFGLVGVSEAAIMPLVILIGMGFIPCCVAQSALAVALYPAALRTTGIGWAAAMGRLGSIAGPGVGGLVLASGWPPQQIVLTAAIPAVAAILLLPAFVKSARATT
ncbi:MFS transporter [Rhizobium straminoryzae]|uniref:Aromatic acid/H+ symport family MFS transporter n=1 Tax=Rhizobium straminoryzae TaxID=1387186 RepID=A0A549THF9_9HYPH|nr:MFS transporter [Rhizobium straminoryzae]TRL42440.1 aromatic acid/H+ symport family MFS transporter [Rhizobium straminoryzae]